MPIADDDLAQRLDLQDRVVARWQALGMGMSPEAWEWRISHGWQSPVPGVAVAHTGTLTEGELAWVAVLHCGKGARLSGDAALAAQGLKTGSGRDQWGRPPLDVAVPVGRQVRPARLPDGRRITPHRVAHLERWPLPTTRAPMLWAHAAVLHAAAWAASDRAAEWRLAAVVQQKLTHVPVIRTTLAQMPRLPRRRLIREVLDDVELGAHAGSELQFLRFCRAHGLPLPDELQVKARAGGTCYLDARYRRQKVTVESDGAHHREAGQWEADQLRSLRLAVARRGTGEELVRISPSALRHDGPEIAGLLRALLA